MCQTETNECDPDPCMNGGTCKVCDQISVCVLS